MLNPNPPSPRANQIITNWRRDSERAYPTTALTPARALAFLQAADHGQPALQFEFFAEMLLKWPRLAAVEATRRLALLGLDWEITPAPTNESAAARRAADFCTQTLQNLPNLRHALDHLAKAIGFGLSVVELVWRRGDLIDLVPVPHSRLITNPDEPWRLRVRTPAAPEQGVPLDEFPAKWLVHAPNPAPGRPFDGGLLRASTLFYVAQNLSFKDWLIYSQIAGMPVRVGKFEPGTPEEDKQTLLRMLADLGTDAVALISKNVDLEFVEANGATDKPYQPLQEHCNTEVTILWLGQHLTTEIRSHGSRAAAEIHDRVREDLLVGDIADEADTLQRDLLTPLVRARFGPDVPVPRFRRSLIQATDTKVLADTLAVAVRELGLRVPTPWVHRALGIPEPTTDEPTINAGDLA